MRQSARVGGEGERAEGGREGRGEGERETAGGGSLECSRTSPASFRAFVAIVGMTASANSATETLNNILLWERVGGVYEKDNNMSRMF